MLLSLSIQETIYVCWHKCSKSQKVGCRRLGSPKNHLKTTQIRMVKSTANMLILFFYSIFFISGGTWFSNFWPVVVLTSQYVFPCLAWNSLANADRWQRGKCLQRRAASTFSTFSWVGFCSLGVWILVNFILRPFPAGKWFSSNFQWFGKNEESCHQLESAGQVEALCKLESSWVNQLNYHFTSFCTLECWLW